MRPEERQAMIQQQLTEIFHPAHLTVLDESHLHIGHSGHGGAGHFAITIEAEAFRGKSLLQCHQLVYEALDSMMGNEIHALRIKAIIPK